MEKKKRRTKTPEFEARVQKIRKHLPKWYGVLFKEAHPEIKKGQLYNVLNAGVQNEFVLSKLEVMFLPKKEAQDGK